ncbi:hypothetical protein N3K66_007745 [Trichothecium roseum]|uniref:Uncharacterized protein n=1 Tax=Trichothecium roseum TaxID=47278 RepID=A0ACC0UUR7_9HYPO|nr:hypothetical protein N3K66_007745 [Trichothecium roseum]
MQGIVYHGTEPQDIVMFGTNAETDAAKMISNIAEKLNEFTLVTPPTFEESMDNLVSGVSKWSAIEKKDVEMRNAEGHSKPFTFGVHPMFTSAQRVPKRKYESATNDSNNDNNSNSGIKDMSNEQEESRSIHGSKRRRLDVDEKSLLAAMGISKKLEIFKANAAKLRNAMLPSFGAPVSPSRVRKLGSANARARSQVLLRRANALGRVSSIHGSPGRRVPRPVIKNY